MFLYRWSRVSRIAVLSVMVLSAWALPDQDPIKLAPVGEPVRVKEGGIWCVPVWDGKHVVVSTENRDGIYAVPYTEDLKEAGAPVLVAGPNDTRGKQHIADHKHVFVRDHHYIVFSTTGAKDSYLVKLDRDLKRMAIVPVTENSDIPTNDMFLVTDGEKLHVGHFLPGRGHRVFSFDADLKPAGKPVAIGDGDRRHSNGAAAIFLDGEFHVLAPKTLAPDAPNAVYHLTFDKDWKPVGERATLIESGERERMVTGLTWLADQKVFVVHYIVAGSGGGGTPGMPDDSGGVKRQFFSQAWKPVGEAEVVAKHGNRPHTMVRENILYIGYDSRDGVFLQRYEIKP